MLATFVFCDKISGLKHLVIYFGSWIQRDQHMLMWLFKLSRMSWSPKCVVEEGKPAPSWQIESREEKELEVARVFPKTPRDYAPLEISGTCLGIATGTWACVKNVSY